MPTDRKRLLLSSALATALWALVLGAAGSILGPGSDGAEARFGDVAVVIGDYRERESGAAEAPLSAPAPQAPPASAPPPSSLPAASPEADPPADAFPQAAADAAGTSSETAEPGSRTASPAAEGAGSADAASTGAAGAAPSPGGEPSANALALLNAAIERNLSYPPQAKRRKIQGRVVVELEVGTNGVLADLSLVRSSGSELLDRAALELLRGLFPLEGARGEAFRTKVAIDYALTPRTD